jgi:mannose-6-phosphate isomerase-like protein (cupin superfamily)
MTAAEHMVNRTRYRKEVVETGEKAIQTSVEHVAAGKGSKSLCVFGEMVMCKITSYQTGGAYSLFEVATQSGSGPPPHIHHREDEAFYVLEGEYEFLVEGRTISAGAASLIYIPKGNLHTHRNIGEGIGRMLVSQTPGGLYERFFEEIGEETKDRPIVPVSENPPDMERIAKTAAEYGIEIPLSPHR